MSCLDRVIGISRTPCDCFTDPASESFNVTESDSDLFMDDLVAIDLVKHSQCGNDGPWKMMRAAFLESLTTFKNDFRKSILKDYKTKHHGYSAWFGSEIKLPHSAAHAVKGIKIVGNGIKGSYLTIKKAMFLTYDPDSTCDLMVLDYEGTSLFEQNISIATSGRWSNPIVITGDEWKLPMWKEGQKDLPIYYIVHNNEFTMENEQACKCGKVTGRHWSDVFDRTGVYSDTLAEGEFYSTDKFGGLAIEIETSCEMDFELCSMVGDQYLEMARIIQLGSAAKFIEKVLKKQVSGFPSTVSTDVLQQQLEGYASQYASGINSLAQTFIPGNCYICNESGMKKKSLLS